MIKFIVLLFVVVNAGLVRLPLKRAQSPNRRLSTSTTGNFYNLENLQYMVPVNIGSNNQEVHLIFDTGSELLWVTNSSAWKEKFYCSESTTCNYIGTVSNIEYGSGDINFADVVQDTVTFQCLAMPNFAIVYANDPTEFPSEMEEFSGGILGMGYNGLAPSGDIQFPMVIQQLVAAGEISSAVFSIVLGFSNSENLTATGEIILGGIDPNYENLSFNYTPATFQYYWMVTLNAFNFGSYSATSLAEQTLIDTGTSLIVFPTPLLDTIVEEMNTLGAACSLNSECDCYVCNCVPIPDMVFTFAGGAQQSLPAWTYLFDLGEGYCQLLLQDGGTSSPQQIVLGDIFIRQFYTVFNAQNSSIGFTPYNNQTVLQTATSCGNSGGGSGKWIAIAALGLLGVAGAGYFVLRHFKRKKLESDSMLGKN